MNDKLPESKDIHQAVKKAKVDIHERHERKKLYDVLLKISLAILIFLIAGMLISELFWGIFTKPPTSFGRHFFYEKCYSRDRRDCEMTFYKKSADFTLDMGNLQFIEANYSLCKNSEILSLSEVKFSDCSFSFIGDTGTVRIRYIDSESGLVLGDHVSVKNYFEVTSIKYVFSSMWNRMTGK